MDEIDEFVDELQKLSLSNLALTSFLSSIDVTSDFGQGYLLYQDPELSKYGILTFSINWIPGVIAAVHLVSNQRRNLGPYKTFLLAGKFVQKRVKFLTL